MHGNGRRRRRCRAGWSGVRPKRGERRPNTERTKWMEDSDEEGEHEHMMSAMGGGLQITRETERDDLFS